MSQQVTAYTWSAPPQKNAVVFNEHGYAARFLMVHPCDSTLLVAPLLDSSGSPVGSADMESDDVECGGVESWPRAWDAPMLPRLQAQANEAISAANKARKELSDIRAEMASLSFERRRLADEAKKHQDLRSFLVWLEGRAKFGVVIEDNYSIRVDSTRAGPVEELFKDSEERYNSKLRLVALYYNPDEVSKYCTRMMTYGDGSGGDRGRVFLGETQEEALELARDYVVTRLNHGHLNDHLLADVGEWLCKFGFSQFRTPKCIEQQDTYAARANERKRDQAKRNLECAQQQLQAAQAAAIKAGVVPL